MKLIYNSEFAVEIKKPKYDKWYYLILYVNDNTKWIKTNQYFKYNSAYFNDFTIPLNNEIERIIWLYKRELDHAQE